jgi:hypothetical protein
VLLQLDQHGMLTSENILSSDVVLTMFSVVLDSNDPIARSITLYVLSILAPLVLHRRDIQHRVFRFLSSPNAAETAAAVSFVVAICRIYPQGIDLSKIERLLHEDATLRQRGLIVAAGFMSYSVPVFSRAYNFCLELLGKATDDVYAVRIVHHMTQLVCRASIHVNEHAQVLCTVLNSQKDSDSKVANQCIRSLQQLALQYTDTDRISTGLVVNSLLDAIIRDSNADSESHSMMRACETVLQLISCDQRESRHHTTAVTDQALCNKISQIAMQSGSMAVLTVALDAKVGNREHHTTRLQKYVDDTMSMCIAERRQLSPLRIQMFEMHCRAIVNHFSTTAADGTPSAAYTQFWTSMCSSTWLKWLHSPLKVMHDASLFISASRILASAFCRSCEAAPDVYLSVLQDAVSEVSVMTAAQKWLSCRASTHSNWTTDQLESAEWIGLRLIRSLLHCQPDAVLDLQHVASDAWRLYTCAIHALQCGAIPAAHRCISAIELDDCNLDRHTHAWMQTVCHLIRSQRSLRADDVHKCISLASLASGKLNDMALLIGLCNVQCTILRCGTDVLSALREHESFMRLVSDSSARAHSLLPPHRHVLDSCASTLADVAHDIKSRWQRFRMAITPRDAIILRDWHERCTVILAAIKAVCEWGVAGKCKVNVSNINGSTSWTSLSHCLTDNCTNADGSILSTNLMDTDDTSMLSQCVPAIIRHCLHGRHWRWPAACFHSSQPCMKHASLSCKWITAQHAHHLSATSSQMAHPRSVRVLLRGTLLPTAFGKSASKAIATHVQIRFNLHLHACIRNKVASDTKASATASETAIRNIERVVTVWKTCAVYRKKTSFCIVANITPSDDIAWNRTSTTCSIRAHCTATCFVVDRQHALWQMHASPLIVPLSHDSYS